MSTQLKILVADPQGEQRSLIEKNVNTLGYYRVMSVSSFRELVTLIRYSSESLERFDLLILNADLMSAVGVDARDFCLGNPQLRHVLIYELHREHHRSNTFSERPRQQVRLIRTPDRKALVDFLLLIDPSFSVAPAQYWLN
ncbi:hypothetical protein [Pseudomonas sp. EL_65y_Pfl2_R96]|uniref:hypothetical protein n=1 Tax=Pseudomonas sp. EL_65y_Pfl2_R96 TaxID=3088699 RepID=UPI0030DA1376